MHPGMLGTVNEARASLGYSPIDGGERPLDLEIWLQHDDGPLGREYRRVKAEIQRLDEIMFYGRRGLP